MMGKYTKTKSKYILRKAHSLSLDGSIFEQDMLTNGELINYSNGNLIVGDGSGVNTITNTQTSETKKYNNGKVSETFTLSDFISELRAEELLSTQIANSEVGSASTSNRDVKTHIKLNKNYFDLTKVAYYGSCVRHIKSSIEDIILRYPASLFINQISVVNSAILTVPLNNVSNPLRIDILNYTPYDRVNMSFNLSVLASSYNSYVVSDSNGVTYANISGFTNDGNNIIFNLDKNITINGSVHIMPNKANVENFFGSLTGIQKTLLNRDSIPKYVSKFKIIEEGEDGDIYKYINFQWPTVDNHNIDVTTIDYLVFMDSIIASAQYIDSTYSDNIYRMLTHSTLKGMDNTYVRNVEIYGDENKKEEVLDGETKIQKLLRIYGRYYDDIKEYIDGISHVNNITYNNLENLNEVYLHDKLDYMGWYAQRLTNVFGITGETNHALYPGVASSLGVAEVDREINRRFIINSKNIFKTKGTVKSIRKIFGLLGVSSDIYDIREYTQDVYDYITGETIQKIKELNGGLRTDAYETSLNKNGVFDNDTILNGLNIKTFVKCPICGELDYVTNFNITNENLLSNSIKLYNNWSMNPGEGIIDYNRLHNRVYLENIRIDGDPCFFWVSQISSSMNENEDYMLSFDLYGTTPLTLAYGNYETVQTFYPTSNTEPLRAVSKIIKTATNHDPYSVIYFIIPQSGWSNSITNIKLEAGNISTPWSPSTQEQELLEYGICVKNKHSFDLTGNTYGYPSARNNTSGFYFQQMGGWYRETGGVHDDISGNTYVTDIMSGNNPHIGDGNYDYGTNYIDNFKQLFKTDIDLQLNYPTIDVTGHTGYGFNLTNKKTVDNNKIIWAADNIFGDKAKDIYTDYGDSISKLKINLKNFVIGIDTEKALSIFTSGNTAYTGGLTEDIIFDTLKKLVLPYIESVMPSTTIFDFVKIDKTMPKWQLVEKYPERTGSTQNYSGNTILRYKNINYYDETTTEVTQDLLDSIERDFGDMFVQYGEVVGSGFDMEVSFIGDNGEYERVTTADWQEADNLFNF